MNDIASQIGSSSESLVRELQVIAHNLANVSTVGFKRCSNSFSRQLRRQQERLGGDVEQIVAQPRLDFSQGRIEATGRTFDFALHGPGFFVIETPGGVFYTRNGSFQVNDKSQIVDSLGNIVAGSHGAITIPEGVSTMDIEVTEEGHIFAAGAEVDKFKIVDFGDETDKLEPVGLNRFSAAAAVSPKNADENTVVRQGYTEASNVNMMEELVDMIMVQRLYEANMKIVGNNKDISGSLLSAAMA